MKLPLAPVVFGYLLFCLVLPGCGSGVSGTRVSGVVTLDGKPLSGAKLEFAPLEATQTIGGDIVTSDSEGRFDIVPDRQKQGLTPGKYGVRVSRWVDRKTGLPPNNSDDIEQLKLAGMLKNQVPLKYNNPESNPILTLDIKAGSNDNVKLELQSR